MEKIATEVADLVLEFGGSLSGEHGDGIVRGVFTEHMFGPTLTNAFREVKRTFDPDGLLNPGKIIETPGFRENLRLEPDAQHLGARHLPRLQLRGRPRRAPPTSATARAPAASTRAACAPPTW